MQTRRMVLSSAAGLLLRAQSNTGMFANAQAYERFMGRWSRKLAPLLVEFAGIRDGMTVLDVGSGTGALTAAIASRFPGCRIVGVDPSKAYTGYASKQAPAGAQFEVGDAQQLTYPDRSFDACLSLLVFNFIPNAGKALGELRRVTRTGGPISAAVWDYGEHMDMLRIFWDAAAELGSGATPPDEQSMPLCHPGELAALWKSGGLSGVTEQSLEITMRFASFDDYWQPFLLKQGPAGGFVARLTPAQQDQLKAALRRHLPKPNQDGSFELRARAWAARGPV